jgi:hypothetical protein
MTLFEECLQALKNYKVLSDNESKQVVELFEEDFKITQWGRIDWSIYSNKYELNSSQDIQSVIQKKFISTEEFIQIIWDEASLPVVECTLENALRVIDDVTAVSFDTWLYNPRHRFVIEYYHEGDITIGFVE